MASLDDLRHVLGGGGGTGSTGGGGDGRAAAAEAVAIEAVAVAERAAVERAGMGVAGRVGGGGVGGAGGRAAEEEEAAAAAARRAEERGRESVRHGSHLPPVDMPHAPRTERRAIVPPSINACTAAGRAEPSPAEDAAARYSAEGARVAAPRGGGRPEAGVALDDALRAVPPHALVEALAAASSCSRAK